MTMEIVGDLRHAASKTLQCCCHCCLHLFGLVDSFQDVNLGCLGSKHAGRQWLLHLQRVVKSCEPKTYRGITSFKTEVFLYCNRNVILKKRSTRVSKKRQETLLQYEESAEADANNQSTTTNALERLANHVHRTREDGLIQLFLVTQ